MADQELGVYIHILGVLAPNGGGGGGCEGGVRGE